MKNMEKGPRVNIEDIDLAELIDHYETLDLKELVQEYLSKQQEIAEQLAVHLPSEQSILSAHRNSKELELLAEIILDKNVELYEAGLLT